MRCLTLACAMREFGWSVEFLSREYEGHLIDLLYEKGFQCTVLPEKQKYIQDSGFYDEYEEAVDSLSVITKEVDLLIVDHYRLGKIFCRQLRLKAKNIMVVDDLANREHDCDLLLDQNLLEDINTRYLGKVNNDCTLLLGAGYSLLRAEFYNVPSKQVVPEKKLLVFFGAADNDNLSLMALNAVVELKGIPLLVDIIINKTHPQKKEIIEQCKVNNNITLHIQTANMAQLMINADLMLGAGGATHWERCTLSLPALIVTLADNQLAATSYLQKMGMCKWIGKSKNINSHIMANYLRHYLIVEEELDNMRKKIAINYPQTGSGTARVLAEIKKHLN